MEVNFIHFQLAMGIAGALLIVILARLLPQVRPLQPAHAQRRASRSNPRATTRPKDENEVRFAGSAAVKTGRSRNLASISTTVPKTSERLGLHEEVMCNLEAAFDLLAAGRINLETYRGLVVAEEKATNLKIFELTGFGPDQFRAIQSRSFADSDLGKASDAIHWCLTWAAGMEAGRVADTASEMASPS